MTDEDGRFVLDGVVAGQYRIGASSGELASLQSIDVMLDAGRTRSGLTLRLADTATMEGMVMSGGRPVAGVRLQTASRVLSSSISPRAISQLDGSFLLRGVARGLNELRLPAHELISPRIIDVVKAEVSGVRVEVAPSAIVRGRVTRQGRPVPNASVVSRAAETRTDENGLFELASLRPGTHTITATTTHARARAGLQLRSGETTHVDLALDAAASISGVLVEQDGRPAPGLIVVFSQARGADFSMCTSAEDGSFKVTRLAGHDTYLPRVQADLAAPAKLSPPPGVSFPEVLVPDGDTHVHGVKLVIRRDHLSIAGIVVDASGARRPDAEVSAVRLDGQGAGSFNEATLYPRTTSAADGGFVISDLDRGSFLLHVRAGDGPEAEMSGVRSGTQGVVLRLPAIGAVAGRLAGFRAPPEVMATALGRSRRQFRATVTADSFSIGELAPGEYQVAALSNEADAVTVSVVGGSTSRTVITARQGATVRARVVELASRRPIAGLTCSVLLGGTAPDPRLRLPGGAVTDEQGRFELSAPAGRPAVECRSPTGATSNGAAILTLAAGQSVDVELRVVQPRLPSPQIGKLTGAYFEPTLLGARLESVVPKSPAERAGLRAGDTLIAVDGTPVEGLTQGGIMLLIYDRPVGAAASMTLARDGQSFTAAVKIASPAD